MTTDDSIRSGSFPSRDAVSPDPGVVRVLVPVGMLGGGFPPETVDRGIAMGADIIADRWRLDRFGSALPRHGDGQDGPRRRRSDLRGHPVGRPWGRDSGGDGVVRDLGRRRRCGLGRRNRGQIAIDGGLAMRSPGSTANSIPVASSEPCRSGRSTPSLRQGRSPPRRSAGAATSSVSWATSRSPTRWPNGPTWYSPAARPTRPSWPPFPCCTAFHRGRSGTPPRSPSAAGCARRGRRAVVCSSPSIETVSDRTAARRGRLHPDQRGRPHDVRERRSLPLTGTRRDARHAGSATYTAVNRSPCPGRGLAPSRPHRAPSSWKAQHRPGTRPSSSPACAILGVLARIDEWCAAVLALSPQPDPGDIRPRPDGIRLTDPPVRPRCRPR